MFYAIFFGRTKKVFFVVLVCLAEFSYNNIWRVFPDHHTHLYTLIVEQLVDNDFRIYLSLSCFKYRFQVVLASQAVPQNLSLESPYSTVWLFVRFLAFLVDCDKIANKLCSHICKCDTVYRKNFSSHCV